MGDSAGTGHAAGTSAVGGLFQYMGGHLVHARWGHPFIQERPAGLQRRARLLDSLLDFLRLACRYARGVTSGDRQKPSRVRQIHPGAGLTHTEAGRSALRPGWAYVKSVITN